MNAAPLLPPSPTASDSPSASIPDEFCCPITLDVFAAPVRAPDGFVYEKSAIERWLRRGVVRSPLGGIPMPPGGLVPQDALREAIARHPVAGSQQERVLAALKAAQASAAWLPTWLLASLGLTVGASVGGGFGYGSQRGVEFLLCYTAGAPVGAIAGALWGGTGTAMWAVSRSLGYDDTLPENMILTGLALPVTAAACAGIFTVATSAAQAAMCYPDLLQCDFSRAVRWGALAGTILGSGPTSSCLGYVAYRLVEACIRGGAAAAEWRGPGEVARALGRDLEATLERTLEGEGHSAAGSPRLTASLAAV